ncbi:unnamed protein product [Nezara viridula]|uniref:SHSP domain-containing protein n=1 Tax=Nezara viridula TaxID=85310 RepID=A0A9P0HHY8_NEZVI|nr:unnamed protein product [Nezara viridula]
MSFMGPSTSGLSRSVLGNADASIQSSRNQTSSNESLDNTDHVSRYFEAPNINPKKNNTMTLDNFSDMFTRPDNRKKTICKFDLKKFKLEELTVRIENGFLVIRGNHKEKRDKFGLISRSFIRRVVVPRNIINNEIRSYFFSNGLLTVTAKKRSRISRIKEITIHQINKPALAEHMIPPNFRQPLNCQKHTMFKPGFLATLDYFRKCAQPSNIQNRCFN